LKERLDLDEEVCLPEQRLPSPRAVVRVAGGHVNDFSREPSPIGQTTAHRDASPDKQANIPREVFFTELFVRVHIDPKLNGSFIQVQIAFEALRQSAKPYPRWLTKLSLLLAALPVSRD
jgi:hypothetical protein